MLYLITTGPITVRKEANDAAAAFDLARNDIGEEMETIGAMGFRVEYIDGDETVVETWKYHNGQAVRELPPDRCWHPDMLYVDDMPSSIPLDAPIVKGKAVIMLGYGVSRPLHMRFRKNYPQAELWTLNQDRMDGAVRHFQIHDPEVRSDMVPEQFNMDDLREKNVKIYDYLNFPYNDIRRNYLCSTADYMLAIADMEGFETICMPGLDFGGMRRPVELHSARFWVGILEGKGCIVHRSPMSLMFRHLTYGLYSIEDLNKVEGN